ncbi:MAG: hypothetical protein H8D80_01500 [Proteobacteria bacterium]|nr:hypothetical protein [Pseudomonadota bacterium]
MTKKADEIKMLQKDIKNIYNMIEKCLDVLSEQQKKINKLSSRMGL